MLNLCSLRIILAVLVFCLFILIMEELWIAIINLLVNLRIKLGRIYILTIPSFPSYEHPASFHFFRSLIS